MNNKNQGKTANSERLPLSVLAAYGSGGIIPIALFNIAGILVGLMGNISLGLSAFWLGFILIIPRLWDAFSDPIIGHISDNTRSRWGRRRPYLLLGGILTAFFFVVMWWIPKGEMVQAWFPTESGFQAFQLIYILIALLLFFTAVNIFEISHGALGIELTTDYHERTRLFSAKSFFGNIFAMSTPWLFKLANMDVFKGTGGNEADGMRYVSIIIAAILVPLSIWWFFRLKEPGFAKAAKHEKTHFWKDMKLVGTNKNFIFLTLTIFTLAMGFNFVQLLGSYIPIFYVFGGDKDAGATLLGINGTIWAITGVLAVFPLNWISPKIGKRNTLIIAIIMMALAQFSKIVCYNPNHPYLIIIPTILLSAGMLFFFTLGSSMVGDICDENELKVGYRSEGSFYSIFWWFIKLGTALASFVSGALIVLTMFDETQVIKVDHIQGSINELQSQVQFWNKQKNTASSNYELLPELEKRLNESLKELNEYSKYLNKEIAKKKNERSLQVSNEWLTVSSSSINSTISILNSEVESIQKMQPANLSDSVITQLANTALTIKIEKAKMYSLDLLNHFNLKLKEAKHSNSHYSSITQEMSNINNIISDMSTISLKELSSKTTVVKTLLPKLTEQPPYTLLMMRIIEIGLPILLSMLSLIFIYRYSLTETRLIEIKQLLKKHNTEPNPA
ncbi:MAG TPA: MFS transporter [Tenuifilaceae bacterium]|nr:MFS transporter [Tenuifilaceae bacterium]